MPEYIYIPSHAVPKGQLKSGDIVDFVAKYKQVPKTDALQLIKPVSNVTTMQAMMQPEFIARDGSECVLYRRVGSRNVIQGRFFKAGQTIILSTKSDSQELALSSRFIRRMDLRLAAAKAR